jgi:hypothetical protein
VRRIVIAITAIVAALPLLRAASDYPFGDRLIDIAFTIDPGAVATLQKDLEAEVPARMRVPDERGTFSEHVVSLRIKGGFGSKRALDEKPAFKASFPKGERVLGLEQLTLNNMVQDHTMVHETLGYHFYDALGIPVPRTGYARVTVNGEPYGLYLNLESIDKPFLARRFGDDSGVLYEGTYGADLRESDVGKLDRHVGSDRDHARLMEFVRAVNTPGDSIFYGDHPLVDARTFLRMTAAEGLIEDWDSYYHSNNYRIYWIPSARRWAFIPTGLDQTFVETSTTPAFGATGLLLQKCLASERCTRDYETAMQEAVDRFEQLNLPARLDEVLRLIGPAAATDARRPYDDERMNGARDRLRGFLERRPADVRRTLSCVDEEKNGVLGACAGVIVKRSANECMEVVPDDADENAGGIGIAACTGTFNERWRVTPVAAGVRLSAAADPTKCVAVKTDGAQAKLGWAACDSTDAAVFTRPQNGPELRLASDRFTGDTWHIQRSIFQ